MAKIVNERQAETVSQTLSSGAEYCPTGGLWKLKTEAQNLFGSSRTLSGRRSLENVIFSQNPPLLPKFDSRAIVLQIK
jgi:hypothetical protein